MQKENWKILFRKRTVSLAKKWSSCWKGRENKGKDWYNGLCFIFRMKEERAVCQNNSKGVENQWRKEMWVISVHKSRYLNGKAGQKISNKNIFILELYFNGVHVFHGSIEWILSPLHPSPSKKFLGTNKIRNLWKWKYFCQEEQCRSKQNITYIVEEAVCSEHLVRSEHLSMYSDIGSFWVLEFFLVLRRIMEKLNTINQ